MKQKKMLSLTLSQIRQLYCQELPELTAMAQQSLDDTDLSCLTNRICKYRPYLFSDAS